MVVLTWRQLLHPLLGLGFVLSISFVFWDWSSRATDGYGHPVFWQFGNDAKHQMDDA